MSEPIRPEAVKKPEPPEPVIPDFVVDAFNTLIQKKWNGIYARVDQNDVVNEILKEAAKANVECKRSEIFDKHWLDVEPLYRRYGWQVEFAKQPYYVTDVDDFFIFKK